MSSVWHFSLVWLYATTLALGGCYLSHERATDETTFGPVAPDEPVEPAEPVAPDVLSPEVVSLTTPTQPQLGVGIGHACLLLKDGSVHCWGSNIFAQFGGERPEPDESTGEQPIRVQPVPGLPDIHQISVGSNHACAVDVDGALHCWGSNEHGQLGVGRGQARDTCSYQQLADEDIECAQLPMVVPDIGPVTHVSAGGTHTCALDVSGQVWCWGYTPMPTRGHTEGIVGRPGLMPDVVNATLLSTSPVGAGGPGHTCALLQDGGVQCWGASTLGQTGPTPELPFRLPEDALHVSAGFAHSCAATDGGAVYCWGHNRQGALGVTDGFRGPCATSICPTPSDNPILRPTRVPSVDSAQQVSTSNTTFDEQSSCALHSGGSVTCWRADMAHNVPSITDASQLSGNCAIANNGVHCWQWLLPPVEIVEVRHLLAD